MKICRVCYGKMHQRVGQDGASGNKRVALEAPDLESQVRESPLDAAAPIKDIVKIIGVRYWDPSKASEPADLREPLADDQIELEYEVFGRFARADRPDSYGLMSTRWLSIEHLVEHVGLGKLKQMIAMWQEDVVKRSAQRVAELVQAAEDAADQED